MNLYSKCIKNKIFVKKKNKQNKKIQVTISPKKIDRWKIST